MGAGIFTPSTSFVDYREDWVFTHGAFGLGYYVSDVKVRGERPTQALGDVEGIVIGELLKSNSSLRALDMSSAELTDIGLQVVSTALNLNTTLSSLTLPQRRDLGRLVSRGIV